MNLGTRLLRREPESRDRAKRQRVTIVLDPYAAHDVPCKTRHEVPYGGGIDHHFMCEPKRLQALNPCTARRKFRLALGHFQLTGWDETRIVANQFR
jgi:hypothetical protein